jgi:hypothetical protein
LDPGLHLLQGEAKLVTAAELAALLLEVYKDKVALRDRHVAGARAVSSYEFNNTYQYIVGREDAQVSWLRRALEESGVPVPADVPALPVPGGSGGVAEPAVIADDSRLEQAFLDRWTPRLPSMSNARHGRMLQVILGETAEHKRFFDQMIEGRADLLGRRHANVGTGGGVLPTRWVE